jgi:hypothetical protein
VQSKYWSFGIDLAVGLRTEEDTEEDEVEEAAHEVAPPLRAPPPRALLQLALHNYNASNDATNIVYKYT